MLIGERGRTTTGAWLRRGAAAFALAGLMAVGAQAATPDLDAVLAKAMAPDGPSAMGALVIKDGRVAAEVVRGVRRKGGSESVRPGDRWHLGSNGKAITATIVAKLVEQRRLSWTKPLDQMLPSLAAGMRPEYRDVTLVDLLSHRAGIREPGGGEADDPFFQSFYADKRPLPQQRLAWAANALSLEPVGEKRGKSRYSNTGYLIAAAVAEQATGRTYEQLAVQHVLRPLRMKSATFTPAGASGDLVGHVEGAPAGPKETNPPMWNPAGGYRMSLADWARFCIDQLEGERGRGKLLKPATYRLLHTKQGDGEALGWSVGGDFAGRKGPILQHTGSDGNWYAVVALFPATRDGLLVTSNTGSAMGGERAAFGAAMGLLPSVSVPASPAKAGSAK